MSIPGQRGHSFSGATLSRMHSIPPTSDRWGDSRTKDDKKEEPKAVLMVDEDASVLCDFLCKTLLVAAG